MPCLPWRATKRRATHNRYFPEFATLICTVDEALAYFAVHPEHVTTLFGRYLDHRTEVPTVDMGTAAAAA